MKKGDRITFKPGGRLPYFPDPDWRTIAQDALSHLRWVQGYAFVKDKELSETVSGFVADIQDRLKPRVLLPADVHVEEQT